jgi:hypothetical protein
VSIILKKNGNVNIGTANGSSDCRADGIFRAQFLLVQEAAQPIGCEIMVDEDGKIFLSVGSPVVDENLVLLCLCYLKTNLQQQKNEL